MVGASPSATDTVASQVMANRKDRRGYALITRDGMVLLVRNRSGRWLLPGGKAKKGESLRAATAREVREETGLRIRLGRRLSGNHVRIHTTDCKRCVVFKARVKNGRLRARREIGKVAWVEQPNVAKRLTAFRRKPIEQALGLRR